MIAAHTSRSTESPQRSSRTLLTERSTDPAEASQSRTVRIGLIGCGGVGEEVVRQCARGAERYRRERAADLQITGILVRDIDRPRDEAVDRSALTTRFGDLLDRAPDLIIEAAGGTDPAQAWITESLRRGIPVVTANKSLIARHGAALRRVAAAYETELAYEAAVGAAVPVIAALRQRAGDRLCAIHAVLNGSTTFILSHMAAHGCELSQSLQEAQRLGLAEPDPSLDLSGIDSAEKLCILAAEAGAAALHPDRLDCRRGIEDITHRDLEAAAAQGCVIRLTARLDVCGGHVRRAVVCPALLPRAHPLARLRGAENGALMHHEDAGPLLLTGCGAGPAPTASAVLGDVIRICRGSRRADEGCGAARTATVPIVDGTVARTRLFLRVQHNDAGTTTALDPHCVLSSLERAGIGVHHIEFRAKRMEAVVDTDVIEEESLRTLLGISPEMSVFCAPLERTDAS